MTETGKPDWQRCLVCGAKPMGELFRHVRQHHGLLIEEYRRRFKIPQRASLANPAAQKRRAQRLQERIERQKVFGIDWRRTLKRIRAGERFSHFAGEAGAPTQGQLFMRRRDDPDFRKRYNAAMNAAGGRSGHKHPRRTWNLVLEYMELGLTLREVEMIPGMPERSATDRHRKRDRAFDEKMRAILGPTGQRPPRWRRGVGSVGRRLAPEGDRVNRFFELIASGLMLKDACLPVDSLTLRVAERWRSRSPEFRARLSQARAKAEAAGLYAPTARCDRVKFNKLIELVESGVPLWTAAERADTPGNPTIARRLRLDPALKERMDLARAAGLQARGGKRFWSTKKGRRSREYLLPAGHVPASSAVKKAEPRPAVARELGSNAAPGSPRRKAAMSATEMIRLVTAAIPRGLPLQVREEVSQEMVLAALTGAFAIEDAGREVQAYIRRAWKNDPGALGRVSFDALADKGFEPGSSPGYGERRHAPA